MIRIVFTGGGTGGHIFPILAIAEKLIFFLPKEEMDFYYFGPLKPSFGISLLSSYGFKIKPIFCGKIRRYFSLQNLKDLLKIPLGVFQALFYLLKIRPNIVFSKGGYGSFPTVLGARILNLPLFIHESDIFPGLANRIASRWAKKIFVSFPQTEYFDLKKTKVVGNPIRDSLLKGSLKKAKEIFNLTFEKKIILFLGGSQGSSKINDFLFQILPQLIKKYEIIHQCGPFEIEKIKRETLLILKKEERKYYHPVGFLKINELPHALKSADLIISRAGAGAIFEIAAVGKPSILIPLFRSAGAHQLKNAYFYKKAGCCEVIEEENLKPHFFLYKISSILENPEKKKEMAKNAKKFAKVDSAKEIALEILDYIMKL